MIKNLVIIFYFIEIQNQIMRSTRGEQVMSRDKPMGGGLAQMYVTKGLAMHFFYIRVYKAAIEYFCRIV